ncbi:MAG: DUF11 domain-containing protein, partial [Saprospiraceae bacterium]|nr:DUF11 domain-containing protein [Saprospiraceae bacterium]
MTSHYLQQGAVRLCSVICMLFLGILVQAQPDISIQISADHNPVSIYTNVTFTIQLENVGSATASNVSADITIPNGLAFVGQTVSGGTYDSWSGIWQVNNLAPGQIETVDVTLFLLTTDPITFPVAVNNVVPADPQQGNNAASTNINGGSGGNP